MSFENEQRHDSYVKQTRNCSKTSEKFMKPLKNSKKKQHHWLNFETHRVLLTCRRVQFRGCALLFLDFGPWSTHLRTWVSDVIVCPFSQVMDPLTRPHSFCVDHFLRMCEKCLIDIFLNISHGSKTII